MLYTFTKLCAQHEFRHLLQERILRLIFRNHHAYFDASSQSFTRPHFPLTAIQRTMDFYSCVRSSDHLLHWPYLARLSSACKRNLLCSLIRTHLSGANYQGKTVGRDDSNSYAKQSTTREQPEGKESERRSEKVGEVRMKISRERRLRLRSLSGRLVKCGLRM